MPRKTPNRAAFNVLLSSEEKAMLKALSTANGTSEGAELRAALRARHAHLISRAPTCANGQNCFMPHLHQPQPFYPPMNNQGNPGNATPQTS